MEEKNSGYFFDRSRETIEVLEALAGHGRLPVIMAIGAWANLRSRKPASWRRSGPGLARQGAHFRRLAGGVSEQPAVVLYDAEAWRRADQGAG